MWHPYFDRFVCYRRYLRIRPSGLFGRAEDSQTSPNSQTGKIIQTLKKFKRPYKETVLKYIIELFANKY